MLKSSTFKGIIRFLALALIATTSLQGVAMAQQPTENNTDQSIKSQFASRLASVKISCKPREYRALFNDMKTAFNRLDDKERNAKPQDRNDIANERVLVYNYAGSLMKACSPSELAIQIESLKQQCDANGAYQLLVKLHRIVLLHKQEYDAAKVLGDLSKINVKRAKTDYDLARNVYDRALKYRAKPCNEKKETGDVDYGGVTVILPDIDEPAEEALPSANTAEDRCSLNDLQPGREEYSANCRNWALILGEWTNREYGGTISFRLLPDNTISAYIGVASERMRKHGYSSGMEVGRGWAFGGIDAGVWKIFAKNGQVFSAKMPDREPEAIYGTAKWLPGGILHIDRDRPGVINLPAQLEGRLSDYKDWVRVGANVSSSAQPQTRPVYCPTIYSPVCAEKERDQRMFNNACEAERESYQPIHIARCRTGDEPQPNPPTFAFHCSLIYKPVCARDLNDLKRTFNNACKAQQEEYSVIYEGQCKPSPIIDPDANSMMCPSNYKPVCGQKNNKIRTFSNQCEATQEDYTVIYQEKCR